MTPVKTLTVTAVSDGVARITAEHWNGELIRMSRRAFLALTKTHRETHPGVYILLDDRFEAPRRELYVGHTGEVDKRVQKHHNEKEFWTQALVFRSNDDRMNVAHTQTIECQFIEWVRNATRYHVTNGTDGAPAHLAADDQKFVDEYATGARAVLELLGIDVFTPNDDAVFTCLKRFGDKTPKSRLRLVSVEPTTVQFLRGSVVYTFDKSEAAATARTALPIDALVHDPSDSTYSFTADAIVETTSRFGGRQSVFGRSIGDWLDDQGRSLATIIKARLKERSD